VENNVLAAIFKNAVLNFIVCVPFRACKLLSATVSCLSSAVTNIQLKINRNVLDRTMFFHRGESLGS